MRQKSMSKNDPAERTVRDIRRKTFAARIKQLDASEARILNALHSADD